MFEKCTPLLILFISFIARSTYQGIFSDRLAMVCFNFDWILFIFYI